MTYDAAFEVIWSSCASGHKRPAFAAWVKSGRPAADLVIARWAVYLKSDTAARGFVKHLSTWFNAGGHEEAQGPSRPPIGPPGANGNARRPSQPPDPRCAFHRGPDSADKRSYCPLPGCPECKHVKARNAARTGEPTGLDAMVADLVNGAAK